MSDVEVNEESYAALAQFQVRQQLCLVNGQDLFYRLDFDDYDIFDEEIDAIAELDDRPVVLDGKCLLSFESQALFREFNFQTNTVRPFKETGAKLRMDTISATQNTVCDSAVNKVTVPSVLHRVLRGVALLQQSVGRR